MKHIFVFDPKAFFNKQWMMDNILDNIGQYFRQQEDSDFSINFMRFRRHAMSIIQDEASKAKTGEEIRVYAIGGEEVVYDCMNAAAHYPNMQLAIVPYSDNDFIKIFGVQKDKEDMLKDITALVTAETLPTDLIKWDVNYAINSCYIGMNAAITKAVKERRAKMNKGLFIAITRISSFFSTMFSAFDKKAAKRQYTITIDDEDYSGQYSAIHIANAPYLNGRLTGSRDATPDDGLLEIALIKSSHPLKTFASLRSYIRGKKPANGIYMQAKKIVIQADTPMWIQTDNEYFQDTHVSITLVHHALHVVAVEGLTYPIGSIPAV